MTPNLRFPKFSNDWRLANLGDFFTFKNGVNADKSMYGSGRKFINVMDVISNAPITHDKIIGSVDISDREFAKNEVLYGDVLFQRSSETREEVGQSNIYIDDKPATFGGFVIRGRPKREIDPYYFNALLKTDAVRKDMTSRSGGSTRYNIGQEALEAVPICLTTDLAEQKKIAQFLGAVDERIALLTLKAESLTQYKCEVARRLFTRELRFRRVDGTDFPEWQQTSLGKLAKRVTERNSNFECKLVLTNSATQGIVSQQEYFDKDIANQENIDAYYVVNTGDFVYNPRISVNAPVGPVKRSAMPKGIMSPLYTVFRFYDGSEAFYEQYFSSKEWHRYMRAIANYGARHDRMAILVADFMAMPLPLPHLDEQHRIADFLLAIDDKIDAVRAKMTAMQTFKKGLLQQMFM